MENGVIMGKTFEQLWKPFEDSISATDSRFKNIAKAYFSEGLNISQAKIAELKSEINLLKNRLEKERKCESVQMAPSPLLEKNFHQGEGASKKLKILSKGVGQARPITPENKTPLRLTGVIGYLDKESLGTTKKRHHRSLKMLREIDENLFNEGLGDWIHKKESGLGSALPVN